MDSRHEETVEQESGLTEEKIDRNMGAAIMSGSRKRLVTKCGVDVYDTDL